MENQNDDFNFIKDKVEELSLKVSPDYPNIEKCDLVERLWAIETTFDGIELANQDLHKFIDILRDKLGYSNDDLMNLWESENN